MNDTNMRVYSLVVNNESRSDKCECERDRQTCKQRQCKNILQDLRSKHRITDGI